MNRINNPDKFNLDPFKDGIKLKIKNHEKSI